MSANIVGTAIGSGKKVLNKSQRVTEVDGLVSLTETYIIRTSDIATIEPDRNTRHSDFSSSSTKYTRMLVESTSIEPMDGDLSQLIVNYVGLDYSTGLPPAYVTAVGRPGAGIFGADISIVVKYINEDSFLTMLQANTVSLRLLRSNINLPTKRLMPSSINGTELPPNPRQREYRRSPQVSLEGGAAVTDYSDFNFYSSSDYLVPVSGFPPRYEWIYAGYVQVSFSFERRGLFNQVTEEFSEYFDASEIFYDSQGIPRRKIIEGFSGRRSFF